MEKMDENDLFYRLFSGLLHGLLLSSVLEGFQAEFHGTHQQSQLEHKNAREDMATRHLYPEWKAVIRTHNHGA